MRSDVAMTGEITLRGKVLPVGGIKEKVLAAHRAGIKTVILPRRNERDLDDVPAELRRELQFVFVDSVEDVLEQALPDATAGLPAAIGTDAARGGGSAGNDGIAAGGPGAAGPAGENRAPIGS